MVGNKLSKVKHNEGCGLIKRIKRSSRIKGGPKAMKGFRQCKLCR